MLLKYLVCSWDIQAQSFKFGENILEIQVHDCQSEVPMSLF